MSDRLGASDPSLQRWAALIRHDMNDLFHARERRPDIVWQRSLFLDQAIEAVDGAGSRE